MNLPEGITSRIRCRISVCAYYQFERGPYTFRMYMFIDQLQYISPVFLFMAVFVFGLVFMFQILDHQHYCYPISFGFLGNCEYCSKICFPSVSSISILPCDLVSYPATVLVMLSSKGLNKKKH